MTHACRVSAAALIVISVATLGACSKQPPPADASPSHAAAQAPSGGIAAPPGSVKTVTGTVAETMDAANYTYARVTTSSGDIWAATGKMKLTAGDKVTVPLEMAMENFHSKALNRDFPVIYFVSRIAREGEPLAAVSPHEGGASGMPTAMSSHGSAAQSATSPGDVKVEPAPGGVTVAKVWADRKSLAGKTVTVRGKVVKVNAGIMDRNWIHIQDGTGNAKDGTNDLLVTSQDLAKVGDTVTVTGKVAVDKDFTSGYKYGVMLETATVK